jgi:Fe-S-cluster containining protein
MEINLTDLKKKAAEKQKENAAYLQKAAKKIPMRAIYEAHEAAFSEIDCMKCANCCKSLGPRFKTPDITRISNRLKIKEADFIENYLTVDEDGDYVAGSLPCPFLDQENHCLIYEDRPGDCRKYPYTDSDVLFKRPKTTLANAAYCPAVYTVLEMLKKVGYKK